MKAVEFISEVKKDSLAIPLEAVAQIPKKQKVKVVVFYSDEEDEEKVWEKESLRKFFEDDSPLDEIYNTL